MFSMPLRSSQNIDMTFGRFSHQQVFPYIGDQELLCMTRSHQEVEKNIRREDQ